MKFLVADDHETARVGISQALADNRDIELIVHVRNGVELTEALKRDTFDFLIMDVSMPHFDPLSAVHLIRAEHPAMFILVVSAYDDDVYVQGLINAGVHGYHLKDQPLRDLTLAIDRILAGEKWVSGRLINKMFTDSKRRRIELSSRQVDIARGLANGLSNKEIAEELTLSIKTIENHLTRLYRQLNVNSRLEAMAYIHDNPQLLGQRGQVMSKNNPPTMPISAPARVSIIIVDDNQRFRKELCGIVGRSLPSANIYEAGNWVELSMLANQVQPRLIFMDVVLGDEDGISLTRKVRQEGQDVKVVLMTAYPDREFHRLAIESGALAMIDKKDLDAPTIKQILYDVCD